MVFPMAAICSGIRFGFACCLFCFVMAKWYVLDYKKTLGDYLILIVSVCFHTSMLMFIATWLIGYLLVPNHISKKLLYLIFGGALLIAPLFYLITEYLPLSSELHNTVLRYTEGENSTADYAIAGANVFGMLKFYLGSYCLQIPIVIMIIYKLPFNYNTKLIYLLLILWCLTFQMFAINGRVMSCVVILGSFYLIKRIKLKSIFISYMICIFFFSTLLNWRVTLNSKWYDLFLPIPVTIHDDYSYNWIMEHNDDNGAPR